MAHNLTWLVPQATRKPLQHWSISEKSMSWTLKSLKFHFQRNIPLQENHAVRDCKIIILNRQLRLPSQLFSKNMVFGETVACLGPVLTIVEWIGKRDLCLKNFRYASLPTLNRMNSIKSNDFRLNRTISDEFSINQHKWSEIIFLFGKNYIFNFD